MKFTMHGNRLAALEGKRAKRVEKVQVRGGIEGCDLSKCETETTVGDGGVVTHRLKSFSLLLKQQKADVGNSKLLNPKPTPTEIVKEAIEKAIKEGRRPPTLMEIVAERGKL
jgi:hypothetical protein